MTQSDTDVIDAFLAATEGLTQAEAAAQAGVSQRQVSSWRGGHRGKLQARTRAALLRFLERQSIASPEMSEQEQALGVFGSFDEIARQLRGIAPPGQAKARKRDALEGLRRTAADFGWPLPDWWYRLKELVDEDQI